MKIVSLLNPPPLFVEIGFDSLKARGDHGDIELSLERGPDGRLTTQGKENVIAALKAFLKAKSWLPHPRAWCAITSRGISLRQLSLPAGSREEFHKRLLLQIEAEFPLPPEELAWGYQTLGQSKPSNGEATRQDLLVAAVKKEFLADYAEVLRACGTEPVFTLAAVARWNHGGQQANSFATLDIGPTQSELTLFENGAPASSRIVFWGGKDLSHSAVPDLEKLAENLKSTPTVTRLFISGNGISKEFIERLAWTLGNGCKCEPLGATPTDNGSAAINGLQKFAAQGSIPPLVLQLKPATATTTSFAAADWKKWGTRAGLLAAAALLLPYAEALLLKPHLEKRVAAFKTEAERLTVIDRELDFLQNLKLSQPPYLDVLYVFSKSAPSGTRFDSLSLNSHGEVSMRCGFHDGQQVADFRDKLIASRFFTNVVVEEQVPTPDHQKVNVRMTAQEKAPAELQLASARLVVDDAPKDHKGTATSNSPAMTPKSLSVRKESP